MTKLGEKRLSSDPVYVLDATPIIHFAKVDKLNLVLAICRAYITKEVYKETVERGGARPDAMMVRDAIERGNLRVYDIHDRSLVMALQRHPEIHAGEAQTIAAAKELNGSAIIDEAEARAVAKTYVVRTRTGTLFLLFRLLSSERIDARACEAMLDELVESGLYVDSRTLIRARQKIREKALKHTR